MWVLYALGGAIFKSYTAFFRKRAKNKPDSSAFVFLTFLIGTLLSLPLLALPNVTLYSLISNQFLVVLGAALFSFLGVYLNVKALELEDLSFVAPLNGFIPLFAVLYEVLFLHSLPPAIGIVGIVIIFVGTYIIALTPDRIHWYDPLLRIFRSKGALLSLAVAASYALNTIFLKMATNSGHSSITVHVATMLAGLVFASHILFTHKRLYIIATWKKEKINILGASASSLFGSLLHIMAVSATYASYAIAVRRSDMIISVLLGAKYLNEESIRYKLIGAIIVTIGTIILALL